MASHLLKAHPDSAPAAQAVTELRATVSRPTADSLLLEWRLAGDICALRLPEPRPTVRADGLWRHTCFEAFLGRDAASDYWEYNFSPSGAWAAYHFTSYREGMAALLKGAPPVIRCDVTAGALEMAVRVDLAWLARSAAGVGLRLGLSAVIEDTARVLSYWALDFPPGKPDFHHADGRVIPLE